MPLQTKLSLRTIIFRVLGGLLGLCAIGVAIFVPLLFIAMESQEFQSAKQYRGHLSIAGAIGSSAAILAFAGFFALVAFVLIRFALHGRGIQFKRRSNKFS